MPYSVQPLKELLVRPAIPASLGRLLELGYNLVWSWDHSIRALFRRLDPLLWKECNHNPIKLLGMLPQAALDAAASDMRYLAMYDKACKRVDEYMARKEHKPGDPAIAYFSMESTDCSTVCRSIRAVSASSPVTT